MEIAQTEQQKIAILRQIERAGYILGMMYAVVNSLDSSEAAVQSAAAYAVWNIARVTIRSIWGQMSVLC